MLKSIIIFLTIFLFSSSSFALDQNFKISIGTWFQLPNIDLTYANSANEKFNLKEFNLDKSLEKRFIPEVYVSWFSKQSDNVANEIRFGFSTLKYENIENCVFMFAIIPIDYVLFSKLNLDILDLTWIWKYQKFNRFHFGTMVDVKVLFLKTISKIQDYKIIGIPLKELPNSVDFMSSLETYAILPSLGTFFSLEVNKSINIKFEIMGSYISNYSYVETKTNFQINLWKQYITMDIGYKYFYFKLLYESPYSWDKSTLEGSLSAHGPTIGLNVGF